MVSLNRLQTRLDNQDADTLLRELADDGLPADLPLRVRLSSEPAAVLGLTLQAAGRLCGPHLLTAWRHRLISCLDDQGRFSDDPAVQAAAIAGLLASGHTGDPTVEQALAALTRQQDDTGLFRFADDHDDFDRYRTSAFIHWLLGDHPLFRSMIRCADFDDALRETADHFGLDVSTPIAPPNSPDPDPSPTPMLAAIAA